MTFIAGIIYPDPGDRFHPQVAASLPGQTTQVRTTTGTATATITAAHANADGGITVELQLHTTGTPVLTPDTMYTLLGPFTVTGDATHVDLPASHPEATP